jgi:plastocyanin
MKLRLAAVGAAATLTALGLTACGDDSASSSEPAALTVTASEPSEGKYAFDVPAEVEGGTVALTFKNSGAQAHEFAIVKVKDGTTADQLVKDLFAADGAPIPGYVIGAPGGGGGTAPGATNVSTVSLDKGTYVYFCTFSSGDEPPHYQNGMLGEFTVKDVTSTAPLPETPASIQPSEYKFDVSGLKVGENSITFENTGKQFHHLVAIPMADGATLDDVNQFLQSNGSGDAPPPVNFDKEQDLAVTGPGQKQVVSMTFDKGSYVFLCFITDKEGGPPHFTKGMLQQVDVS